MRRLSSKIFVLAILGVFIFYSLVALSSATPSGGATVFINSSSAGQVNTTNSIDALAQNVTEVVIESRATTSSWQGYFGNVTGATRLADANGNSMYNWTTLSPTGEIFASPNSTIDWANIQCFNFSANGSYADESGNGGTTNKYGTNSSILEAMYGIDVEDPDGVDETFNLNGSGTHNTFVVSQHQFSEGQCPNVRIFANAGTGENDKFEEILLYAPQTQSVVFTSILNQDILGFDNRTHDFEMLVLEDGHGANVGTTPYYFFLELGA